MTRPLRGEGCWDTSGITDASQARGVLTIHASCDPPCARRRAAAAFLGVDLNSSETRG